MANNPLNKLKKRLTDKKRAFHLIGRVIGASAGMVTIETEAGTMARVWGSADLGSWA